jgi:hypothetical protein
VQRALTSGDGRVFSTPPRAPPHGEATEATAEGALSASAVGVWLDAGTDASTAPAVQRDWDGRRSVAVHMEAPDPLGVSFLSEAGAAAFDTQWTRTFEGVLALPTARVVPEAELVRPPPFP